MEEKVLNVTHRGDRGNKLTEARKKKYIIREGGCGTNSTLVIGTSRENNLTRHFRVMVSEPVDNRITDPSYRRKTVSNIRFDLDGDVCGACLISYLQLC